MLLLSILDISRTGSATEWFPRRDDLHRDEIEIINIFLILKGVGMRRPGVSRSERRADFQTADSEGDLLTGFKTRSFSPDRLRAGFIARCSIPSIDERLLRRTGVDGLDRRDISDSTLRPSPEAPQGRIACMRSSL